MARQPKPFLHRGHWKTNLGGVRTILCPEAAGKDMAMEKLLQLRLDKAQFGYMEMMNATVEQLAALFLKTVKAEKSKSTYISYQGRLADFVSEYGSRRVRDVKKFEAQQYILSLRARTYTRGKSKVQHPFANKTINHAIIALKRLWNWAINAEIIPPRNPFARMPFLQTSGRKRRVSWEEFRTVLRHSKNKHFKQFWMALYYTPARPGDLRSLTWPMIDWANKRFSLPIHKTLTQLKVPRNHIVPFDEEVKRLLEYRRRMYGDTERVFLNSRGRPWTKEAVDLNMRHIRKRAGMKQDGNGENLVLYSTRHNYLSVGAGVVKLPLLQQLGDHQDIRTTMKYVHPNLAELNLAADEVVKRLRPEQKPKTDTETGK